MKGQFTTRNGHSGHCKIITSATQTINKIITDTVSALLGQSIIRTEYKKWVTVEMKIWSSRKENEIPAWHRSPVKNHIVYRSIRTNMKMMSKCLSLINSKLDLRICSLRGLITLHQDTQMAKSTQCNLGSTDPFDFFKVSFLMPYVKL